MTDPVVHIGGILIWVLFANVFIEIGRLLERRHRSREDR